MRFGINFVREGLKACGSIQSGDVVLRAGRF